MRVLLVSESPTMFGGAQLVCKELGRRLPQQGHYVATLRPKPQDPAFDFASGTEIFTLDRSNRDCSRSSILIALNAFKPDVVHVVSGRLLLLNRIDVLVRRTPWLLTVHNPVPQEATIKRFYGHNRIFYIARDMRYAVNMFGYVAMLRHWRFARALCFNESVAKRLIAYGCKASSVIVVPLGTPEATEKAAKSLGEVGVFGKNEYPRIMTVAGIAHTKGLHDALFAIKGLVAQYPKLRYAIIGPVRDSGYAAHLEQTVQQLKLTRHVSFFSNKNDFLKNAALKEADLYLQPSHEEGFCLAFLEAAMNAGRLVGTNEGEMPAIAADDPLIRIVPRMNPGALQQSILTLLGVPVSIEILTMRRMRLEKKYSWSTFSARITSLYKDILSNHKGIGETPIEL